MRHLIQTALVALTLALSLRTFFLMPVAIPTGSMQPTLWGTRQEVMPADVRPPGTLRRLGDRLFRGVSWERDPDEDGWTRLRRGDRALVDRVTYNVRPPRRGEVVVFVAAGLAPPRDGSRGGAVYVKRLVGLPGESIRIGDDRRVVVNGRPLDAATPGFEGVYAFTNPPAADRYAGHANGNVARRLLAPEGLAPLFPDARVERVVRPGHVLLLGDNTLRSWDSRAWGDLPLARVLGRVVVVWWPWQR